MSEPEVVGTSGDASPSKRSLACNSIQTSKRPAQNEKASGESAVRLLIELEVDVLAQLRVLDVSFSGVKVFPDKALTLCKQLVHLDIGGNPLSSFPLAIVTLPHLDILFASKLGLAELPLDLARCPCLRMLSVKDNSLTRIDGAGLPESLEWLIAAGNQVHELPNVARLKHVRKLMLSHNNLTCKGLAPVAEIPALEMIRVAANRLEAFPEALLRHPRLAWIAVGGNPFADEALEKHLGGGLECMDFKELTLGDRLGSGAGATVHRGTWREQSVAVKIWDSERFSDGTAQNEWAVNHFASTPGHPALVSVLGAFDKPKRGLVLELLEDACAAAGPPTFSTITRDALPRDGGPGPLYTIAAVKAIALAIAASCAYLHKKGIMHGDIYLHNTLVVLDGPKDAATVKDVRLSDFGAAGAVGDSLRRLEVRSYGWLLQDLLESHVEPTSNEDAFNVSLLQEIRAQCGQALPEKLPAFEDIVSRIAGPMANM